MSDDPTYDEESRPVPAVDFDFDAIEPELSPVARDVQTVQDLLYLLVEMQPRRDAWPALVAAVVREMNVQNWSQADVARKLKISSSAITSARKKLNAAFKTKREIDRVRPANYGPNAASHKKS